MIKNGKFHSFNPNNSQQFSHTHANLHHIEFSFHIAPCFFKCSLARVLLYFLLFGQSAKLFRVGCLAK